MKAFKTLILIGTGFLLMGNQSCDKQPAVEVPKVRVLKKIVDVGLIESAMIDMPGGQKFDFQFVLNQQMYPVLQKSEGFWFRYKPPFAESSSQLGSNIELSTMNLTSEDIDLFQRSFDSQSLPSSIKSDEISCLVNLPQFRLWGSVNSFELLSRIGIGLGFTQTGNYNPDGMLGVDFQVEHYQLDMNMVAGHPLTRAVDAATNVTSKQTRTQLEFNLPLNNLLINPSYYHQTPLARVSYKALEKAVGAIQDQLNSVEWHTRVLFADEHVATILAGSGHNVVAGDVFNIYNEKTFWASTNGEVPVPCASTYKGSIDGEPIARIEIFDVSNEIAAGKVVWESGLQIKMGAKVKIQKLKEPDATKAADNANSNLKAKSKK